MNRQSEGATAALEGAIELTIVVPTFNESENINLLVERLYGVMGDTNWEVIFVDDDSPDKTAELVRGIALRNRRVRCLQRIGRRGLSTAVIEGILSSSAPVIAVMDADLQHDESLIPKMWAAINEQDVDVVVASRYVEGGGVGEWSQMRQWMSKLATRSGRLIIDAELSDPMSGFFMIRRQAFDGAVRRLSGEGFKILLDLFASTTRSYRYLELPYQFRSRLHGESKLDGMAVWSYLVLILDKLIGHYIPVRFVMFGLVGGLGVVVHLVVLSLGLKTGEFSFPVAQTVATYVAMTSNYLLNNLLTFRDQTHKGWALLWGSLSFYAICSVGVVANVGVATLVFERELLWWVAGISGAFISAVWNYAVSSIFTWSRK